MAKIVLTRSGQAPLAFDGERIAQASGAELGKNRWYELAIFKAKEGLFVGSCAFRTRWEGESELHQAGAARTAEGIVRWFREIDPNPEHFGFPDRREYDIKQAKLAGMLRDQYDELVRQMLSVSGETFAAGIDGIEIMEDSE